MWCFWLLCFLSSSFCFQCLYAPVKSIPRECFSHFVGVNLLAPTSTLNLTSQPSVRQPRTSTWLHAQLHCATLYILYRVTCRANCWVFRVENMEETLPKLCTLTPFTLSVLISHGLRAYHWSLFQTWVRVNHNPVDSEGFIFTVYCLQWTLTSSQVRFPRFQWPTQTWNVNQKSGDCQGSQCLRVVSWGLGCGCDQSIERSSFILWYSAHSVQYVVQICGADSADIHNSQEITGASWKGYPPIHPFIHRSIN